MGGVRLDSTDQRHWHRQLNPPWVDTLGLHVRQQAPQQQATARVTNFI